MTIKYLVNNLNHILENKNRGHVLDVYVSQRIKDVHIAFDRPLMLLDNVDEILRLILSKWGKFGNNSAYHVVFPRLIYNIHW